MVDTDSPEGDYALAHPTLGTIIFSTDVEGMAQISLEALTSMVDAYDKLDAEVRGYRSALLRTVREDGSVIYDLTNGFSTALVEALESEDGVGTIIDESEAE